MVEMRRRRRSNLNEPPEGRRRDMRRPTTCADDYQIEYTGAREREREDRMGDWSSVGRPKREEMGHAAIGTCTHTHTHALGEAIFAVRVVCTVYMMIDAIQYGRP
jgi:hypothetical protein